MFQTIPKHAELLLPLQEVKRNVILEYPCSLVQFLPAVDPEVEEVQDLVEYIATEPRMRSVQKTLEVVRAHGLISETKLIKEVWRTLNRPQEFYDAVGLLVKAKEIEGPETIKGSFHYRYKGGK